MNTDTPRTDEWETYCDECYYHLWRVRRKNERGFNDGYHVHNGDEAKALVDLLNKQDSELTAVTEQRDRLINSIEPLKYWRDISECDCSNPLPQGGCLRCDLERILKTTNTNKQ